MLIEIVRYGEFLLSQHNPFSKIWWINEFAIGRLTRYSLRLIIIIISVLGKYGRLEGLVDIVWQINKNSLYINPYCLLA